MMLNSISRMSVESLSTYTDLCLFNSDGDVCMLALLVEKGKG